MKILRNSMEPYTFKFTERDAYGCTNIEKDAFRKELGLTHVKPVIIKKVNGLEYKVDAIKCVSKGKTFYQLDLTELGKLQDAMVTLWPCPEGNKNRVHMTVVQPSHLMWQRGGVVDAIVELQRRLDEVEDHLQYSDCLCGDVAI